MLKVVFIRTTRIKSDYETLGRDEINELSLTNIPEGKVCFSYLYIDKDV